MFYLQDLSGYVREKYTTDEMNEALAKNHTLTFIEVDNPDVHNCEVAMAKVGVACTCGQHDEEPEPSYTEKMALKGRAHLASASEQLQGIIDTLSQEAVATNDESYSKALSAIVKGLNDVHRHQNRANTYFVLLAQY